MRGGKIWQKGAQHINPPIFSPPLLSPSHVLVAFLWMNEQKYTMGMNMGEGVGQPGSPALSALLIRKSDLFEEGGEEDGDPFLSQYVEHMPTGEEVPRPRRNMHAAGTAGALKLLREVGCKPENAQILTAITWDSRKEALTFVLGERDMGRMREEGGWGVVLWRIDSYQVLSWPTPLEKATKVVW